VVPAYAYRGSQFLSRAIEMSAAEIRISVMARNQGENSEVKAFAEMVVTDQNKALRKLVDLRAARTTTRATSQEIAAQTGRRADRIHRTADDIPLTAEHHRTLDQLSSVSDDEFDRQFINEMVHEYRDVISLFESQTHSRGNEAVKAAAREPQDYSPEDLLKDLDTADFASDTLPTLRLRLKQAEAIQKRLKKR
jgi:predicted outer membrane protein